jgi:hypothetical protein
MTLQPNRSQWVVIWAITVIVLGLWLTSAPWADLSIPTVSEQQTAYDRDPPRRTVWDRAGRGRIVADFFMPDSRGDRAREEVRNRVIVSLLLTGGLLVWQLAGNRDNRPIE